jgi:hypothetical protein
LESSTKVEDVLITSELWRRRPDEVDPEMLDEARHRIAYSLSGTGQDVLQALVDSTITLCGAHTAGFSVLRKKEDGTDYFRWDAMAGVLRHAVGGSTPRDWSPCGVTLDRQSAQLFWYPERFFTYFAKTKPAIVEGLVLPVFIETNCPLGTLWIVSHDKHLKFTSRHVQIMNSLAHFCAAAIKLKRTEAA